MNESVFNSVDRSQNGIKRNSAFFVTLYLLNLTQAWAQGVFQGSCSFFFCAIVWIVKQLNNENTGQKTPQYCKKTTDRIGGFPIWAAEFFGSTE